MASYHDYVIKDGQFVGKFDEMYATFEDPWIQSTQPNPYSRLCQIANIHRFGIKSLVEFGSGLGYYSQMIYQHTGIIPKGVEISPVAVEKARQKFPHLDFEVGKVQDIAAYAQYDAILFAEITWYILPDLDQLFEDMLTHFRGKYFLHNLVFYKGSQRYGREYFTTLQDFIDRVPFQLVGQVEGTTVQDTNIDTATIFRIEPK